ncbi:hypothetical protein [Kitasatospora sp. GP82]|uniref:hypothetical protein n=1 Tax=Kitasatospora sp. GP82 TaxID=3035089 RepID=UPI002473DE74|nr:hypothetical protein [Kitasatospora sp. GP82]MDH6123442.1 hypothetical protein [Kitasatospora sp. GP82]
MGLSLIDTQALGALLGASGVDLHPREVAKLVQRVAALPQQDRDHLQDLLRSTAMDLAHQREVAAEHFPARQIVSTASNRCVVGVWAYETEAWLNHQVSGGAGGEERSDRPDSIDLPGLESASGKRYSTTKAALWLLQTVEPASEVGSTSEGTSEWHVHGPFSGGITRSIEQALANVRYALLLLAIPAVRPRRAVMRPTHYPRTWACACGSERLAGPVIPRAPQGAPLLTFCPQGRRDQPRRWFCLAA